ncbi:hypothetical protein [Sulfurimonas marina]|uniref:Lipoprotein n=1 Tax=Sulfurimonas marina TaxID=2590551 RepID=A0A7M1AVY6_9BACT|nr:hypothetical protein [Sulfurimonas marina]QOP41546.1 hypothetical protein FJR03_07220 [Sulfurimonas marina]
MKNYIFFTLTALTIVFSGCSTKEVFEPKSVEADWDKESSIESDLVDRAYNVALLDNGKVLDKDGVKDITIDEDKRLISESDGWIISASIDGNVSIVSIADSNITKNIDLKNTIAAASIKDNILAVLFANNDMALYDINTKALVLKEQGSKSLAVDMKIVNPYFMKDLVIFSTLDGKIVIINATVKKRLRTVIVSSQDKFNNIIYFNMIDNKIIAATGTKILSLAQKEIRQKYEIRSIIDDDKMLYIATKQGDVISLTPELEVVNKTKFPFAHILGMVSDEEKIYLLEKEEYLIEIDKKTFEYKIYESDFSDGFVFVGDKVFYVDDTKISIK